MQTLLAEMSIIWAGAEILFLLFSLSPFSLTFSFLFYFLSLSQLFMGMVCGPSNHFTPPISLIQQGFIRTTKRSGHDLRATLSSHFLSPLIYVYRHHTRHLEHSFLWCYGSERRTFFFFLRFFLHFLPLFLCSPTALRILACKPFNIRFHIVSDYMSIAPILIFSLNHDLRRLFFHRLCSSRFLAAGSSMDNNY